MDLIVKYATMKPYFHVINASINLLFNQNWSKIDQFWKG